MEQVEQRFTRFRSCTAPTVWPNTSCSQRRDIAMKRVTRQDILSNEEYLKIRDEKRREMIALKKKRRIDVGKKISLTFENRDTVIYQIQEMMRVEHIEEEEKIQHEIDVYNEL